MLGILAMAGLAEAAFFYGMLLIAGILLAVTGLLWFARWKQSIVAAAVSCVALLLAGFLLQPWSAFNPPSSNDPDEAYWLFWTRVASIVWMFLAITTAVCLTKLIRRRKLAPRPQT